MMEPTVVKFGTVRDLLAGLGICDELDAMAIADDAEVLVSTGVNDAEVLFSTGGEESEGVKCFILAIESPEGWPR